METYVKVRFVSASHQTAGLVFKSSDLLQHNVSSLSRAFPYREFLRLGNRLVSLEMSPEMPTWEAAFGHQFASK
jgi:hypothetical protein